MIKTFRRKLGQVFRNAGERLQQKSQQQEQICTQNNLVDLYDLQPTVSLNGFQSPNSVIAGEVMIGKHSNIWHNTVIRGDLQQVSIGNHCVVNDSCVISTCGSLANGLPSRVEVGDNVWIGSHCIIYSANIKGNCYIGNNSQILEGAIIEEGSIIGPNSVVPPGRVIPAHQLWAGNPVEYVKDVSKADINQIQNIVRYDHQLAAEHRAQYLPFRTNYLLKNNHTDIPQKDQLVNQTLSVEHIRNERVLSDIYY